MTLSVDVRASVLADRVTAIVASMLRLPVACVGPFAQFASLGMDSLAAMELTAAIEDELGIELPVSAVYEYPDVDSLCRFIERGGASQAHERRHEMMRADAVLPCDIVPPANAAVLTRDAREVLLTGATGFVGAYILRTLVDETSARIHCVVRSGGLERVRASLESYGLWTAEVADRVCLVSADLAKPLLGLGAEEFSKLSCSVDAIYHAAADVNWVNGYETLRDTNVLGTGELLRLACTGTAKPFHFLSSVSVCHSTTGPRVADEDVDPMNAITGLRLGYAQSKCVAEALVRSAGARGLPVTIIRPSLVSGDSATGRSNVDDLTSRFIAGCIRMHAAPDLDWRLDCVPVDHVARAVVALARRHEGGAVVSHITAASPRHWRECVLWMRVCGYDIELVPYREWTSMLRATDDATQPLHALRSFFLHTIEAENHLTLPELFEESRRAQVAAARTNEVLGELGHRGRAIDTRLLSSYFDDFVKRGSVPESPRGRRSREASDAIVPDLHGLEPALARGLGEWLGASSTLVDRIDLTPFATDESIVAELTAWRAETPSGLFHANVSVRDSAGGVRDVPLFIKAKAADAQMIEVAVAVGELASPALGRTVEQFRDHLGFTRCHVRELALYASPDERLRGHTPRVIAIDRDDAGRRWLVALESIDDALLINATDPARWHDAAIDAALAGLAQIHSVWYARESELVSEPWLAPVRDAARRIEMAPLWCALAQHAHERSSALADARIRRIHEQLVESVGSWASALDATPRTLIHNDFNPRNIAIRPSAGGLKLCAFDWELATLGAPQRDLAEFMCFVLAPNAGQMAVARWVERYRALLEGATGTTIDRASWNRGFSAALCDFLVDRVSSYVMVDRIRPQRFVTRVTESWKNIYRFFPWDP